MSTTNPGPGEWAWERLNSLREQMAYDFRRTGMSMADYGEQGADTNGLAAQGLWPGWSWLGSDGIRRRSRIANNIFDPGHTHGILWPSVAELEARIASRDKTIDALTRQIIGMDATMAGLRTEAKRLSDLLIAQEDKSREAVVTDSEKAADQMRQDILGGKIDKAGRQVVRDACDKMDAPKTGRDASNDALGNISRRGGW